MSFVPLDEYGLEVEGDKDTIAADSAGFVHIVIDQASDQTLWYGIDAFEYTDPVSTERIEGQGRKLELECFPNPARDILHFEFDHPRNRESDLGIYDMTGKLVISEKITGSLSISTADWLPGTYYYRCQTGDGILLGKFMVLK